MFERQIGIAAVKDAIAKGELIAARPDDLPFPSRLLLGFHRGRPLHILVSEDAASQVRRVVTLYEPERSLWSDDFKRRRQT